MKNLIVVGLIFCLTGCYENGHRSPNKATNVHSVLVHEQGDSSREASGNTQSGRGAAGSPRTPGVGSAGSASPQGPGSTGGGFVDENSKAILDLTIADLVKHFNLANPDSFKNFPEKWQAPILAQMVKDIRIKADETKQRDGRDLMFDYGADEKGSFIAVLKPFFHAYASVPVKLESEDEIKKISQDIELKILHELAHHVLSHNNDKRPVAEIEAEAEKFAMNTLVSLNYGYFICYDRQHISSNFVRAPELASEEPSSDKERDADKKNNDVYFFNYQIEHQNTVGTIQMLGSVGAAPNMTAIIEKIKKELLPEDKFSYPTDFFYLMGSRISDGNFKLDVDVHYNMNESLVTFDTGFKNTESGLFVSQEIKNHKYENPINEDELAKMVPEGKPFLGSTQNCETLDQADLSIDRKKSEALVTYTFDYKSTHDKVLLASEHSVTNFKYRCEDVYQVIELK